MIPTLWIFEQIPLQSIAVSPIALMPTILTGILIAMKLATEQWIFGA